MKLYRSRPNHVDLLTIICSLLMIILGCDKQPQIIHLQQGMTIDQSGIVKQKQLLAPLSDSLAIALKIHGENLNIDFVNCKIDGSRDVTRPDRFQGVGIQITGRNITIRNAIISGYKIALIAEKVDGLVIENCNFSYNFRQRLGSTREKEDLNDWLYYHENESDEWKRYGAAVYLKDCPNATIRGLKVTQGQNGIMLTQCSNALIYNNDIRYNSGIGIGLYRSSSNRIMHNRLDFNVRGYSHGIYQRGQDSAGLLAYEQCNNNIFAFNSATHSGDGFFLWAGQHSMDTGEGGCNGNLIYANDFSHAPSNGIEVTFSSNYLVDNKIVECRYGIWGGYSFETSITGNDISNCQFAIAIEHGNNNLISTNSISDSETGIKLWSRDKQPEDWGFAHARDITSRQYTIAHNEFTNVQKPLDISETDSVALFENKIDGKIDYQSSGKFENFQIPELPPAMPDGAKVMLGENELRGRKYIIVNEWGPYNFEYPLIWLRETKDEKYIFALFGPEGNWIIKSATGFRNGSLKSGTFPNSLIADRTDLTETAIIEIEFIGQSFIDQFGQEQNKGVPYLFRYGS
ncbi:MAG: right-handed parallel beta-helix repeat-containing protein [Saprospiraceae bacterium]|nr:right-handed parallel beta-helix repeat-containing protein [Saprospiraceae bacterium]